MSARYSITPVSVGTVTIDRSQMVWGQGYGTKLQAPVMMFYVEGNGQRILFDTGCCDPESAAKYHYPFVRKPEEDPTRALEAIRVHPSEIDIVVASHLHWDHCYNHELFTGARFLIQRIELQFAAAPFPIFANAYEAPTTGMTPPYSRTVFEVLDGDLDLADGLKVVFAPGHTPGMQCLLVNTGEGVYYIAGDNVGLYDNLEGNRFGKPIPGINFIDLAEYYRTMRDMLKMSDHVLPGHDMRVIDRQKYG